MLPPPGGMAPAARFSFWQLASQPSATAVLPSSHCSPRVESITPSPQRGSVQSGRHGASGTFAFAAPASHASTPLWTTPSPHVFRLQLLLHASASLVFPSSHSSSGSSVPLPQFGSWHPSGQKSPSTKLPSSHSSPGSTIPSPQQCVDVRVIVKWSVFSTAIATLSQLVICPVTWMEPTRNATAFPERVPDSGVLANK